MRPLGVYIHFPFCQRRCPYCDFRVDVARVIPHRAYADAVISELRDRRGATEGRALRSIYLGGGTPSLWEVGELGRVVEAVREGAGDEGAEGAEITVEVNPTVRGIADPGVGVFEALRAVGVNRLSLGVQSFDARRLEELGRWHSAEDAEAALGAACDAGFERVSFDLICALPGQTLGEWREQLARAARHVARAPIGHLSVYELTYHAGTPFAERKEAGRLTPVEDDEAADMLAETSRWAREVGMERYEVSNYARPGHESRHNGAYWQGVEYVGLGVGAHSMERRGGAIVRRANGPSTAAYLASGGRDGFSEERLSLEEHWVERTYLGLRTRDGIDLGAVEEDLGIAPPPGLRDGLEACERLGMLREASGRWLPTDRGFDFADDVALRLVAAAGG
jgi:putative oxygen-independent coproporphyrinogen III oxidase